MPNTNITGTVRSNSFIQVTPPADASGLAPKKLQKKPAATDMFEGKSKKTSAPASTNAGLKLVAKMTSGAVIGGGLLAFTGYGMFAAAPHIAALFGVIAASPATVPILATVGAVVGTVAVVLVIRAVYKKVKADQLRQANAAALKAEAQQNQQETPAPTAPAPSTLGDVDVTKLGEAIRQKEQAKLQLANEREYSASLQQWLDNPAPKEISDVAEVTQNLHASQATIAQLEQELATV